MKRLLVIMLLFLVLLGTVGCGVTQTVGIPENAIEFSLSDMKDVDGNFAFPGIKWGMNENEVIEALDLPADTSLRVSDYENNAWVKLILGNKEYGGAFSYNKTSPNLSSVLSFFDDVTIMISAVPSDYQTAFTKITEEMTALHGDPSRVLDPEVNELGMTSEWKIWNVRVNEVTSAITLGVVEGSNEDDVDVSGVRLRIEYYH